MGLTTSEHARLAFLYMQASLEHESQGELDLAADCWNLSNDHSNAAVRRLNEEPYPAILTMPRS